MTWPKSHSREATAERSEKEKKSHGAPMMTTNRLNNHDTGRTWLTTHGSDERGQNAEAEPRIEVQRSEHAQRRITDCHDDSAQVVARGADTLGKHAADGTQPQHSGYSGVRLEWDYVEFRARMTKARNSRGNNFAMEDVLGRLKCGQVIKIVHQLLKMQNK